MNKQSVISLLLKAKQPLFQNCGVKQLGLFGSTVRGSNTESSDVDILIDFEDDKETYSNFLMACEVFDRLKVDIVTRKGLSPFISQQVLKEVEYV
jgi:predicted nucleotidyltransferase